MLGPGRPQIVAPPARLTGADAQGLPARQGRRRQAWRWREVPLELDNPEKIDAAYGVAAVADMDGDGKLDIVFGGHGSGPAIAFNKGGRQLLDRVARPAAADLHARDRDRAT